MRLPAAIGHRGGLVLALGALAPLAVAAGPCDIPDEGNAPLRRAVLRVRHLPETEAWAAQQAREGARVQFTLLLDEPRRLGRACYWPVETRADGKLWKRHLVAPDGRRVIEETR